VNTHDDAPPAQGTVLVTGAAGFIGSHVTDRLLAGGASVVGVDNFNEYYNPQRKRQNLEAAQQRDRFTLIEADLRDVDAIGRAFDEHRPTAVAHLGAYGGVRYSVGRAKLYNDVNVTGSVNVLEVAREHEVDQFVFASTSSVYGHSQRVPFVETDPCNQPLAPYPASKKMVEVLGYTYHLLHSMNFTALRFFSVYGPRGRPDMMPFLVTDHIVKGEPVTLFDAGKMKRDWTYINDIVDGVVAALGRRLGYQIINLGHGQPVLMTQFVAIIEKLVGRKAQLENPPAPPSEPKITFADIDKARQLLDYNPRINVDDGLEQFYKWYQRHVAN